MDAPALVALAVLIGCFGAIAWMARRARRIFVVRVVRGRIQSARGRLAATMLHDLEDVFRASGESGTVSANVRGGQVSVDASSHLSPGTVQRVRNVVGVVPLARLRTAKKR